MGRLVLQAKLPRARGRGRRGREERLTGATQVSGPPVSQAEIFKHPPKTSPGLTPKNPPLSRLPHPLLLSPSSPPPSLRSNRTEGGPEKKKGKEGGWHRGSGVCSPQYGAPSRHPPPLFLDGHRLWVNCQGLGWGPTLARQRGAGGKKGGVCCGFWRVSRGPGPEHTRIALESPEGESGRVSAVVRFDPQDLRGPLRLAVSPLQNRCLGFVCSKICRERPHGSTPGHISCSHPFFPPIRPGRPGQPALPTPY